MCIPAKSKHLYSSDGKCWKLKYDAATIALAATQGLGPE
jgi:hypothetical protein